MRLVRTNRVLVASGLAVLLFAAIGCGTAPESSGAAPPVEGAADDGGVRWAPAFELVDLEGRSVTLEETQGQVRLLDFWATWCAPCREEIPMLNELHDKYAEAGFTIMAISDETPEELQPFVDEHGIAYTNLVCDEELKTEYGVFGLPTAYLVDREGRIVDFFVGAKPKSVLEKRIRELLELPPAT